MESLQKGQPKTKVDNRRTPWGFRLHDYEQGRGQGETTFVNHEGIDTRIEQADDLMRTVLQWEHAVKDEERLVREITLKNGTKRGWYSWRMLNDKHRAQCLTSMVYDPEEDWYLYCIIKDVGLKGWKERIPNTSRHWTGSGPKDKPENWMRTHSNGPRLKSTYRI
jgi:hypothetical protein